MKNFTLVQCHMILQKSFYDVDFLSSQSKMVMNCGIHDTVSFLFFDKVWSTAFVWNRFFCNLIYDYIFFSQSNAFFMNKSINFFKG